MSKARILVVEDEGLTGVYIEKTLNDLGYTVTSVEFSGEEAIEKAALDRPDLVLMDIKLQGEIDGIQAAEEIRNLYDIPVIYLTAHSDEVSLQRAKVTEPFGYVIKPFESRELHSVIEMGLYKHEMENKLKQLAHYDNLTGLPNRTLFIDRLNQTIAHAERYKRSFALLFIDLDEFKLVNDTFGHDIGDLLLKEAASRLSSAVRKSDSIARIGGDEFTVISRDIAQKQSAKVLAERLINSIKEPFIFNDKMCFVGASIGISFFPTDGSNLEAIIKKADIAMYHAKRMGKNNYQFFTKATENFCILVRIIGDFVTEHNGTWNHSDWLKLLLNIQKQGIKLWCSSMQDELGMVLEALKKFYQIVEKNPPHVLTILCEETAQMIQIRKEVYRYIDLKDTLKALGMADVNLKNEVKLSIEKFIEAVQSLYWIIAKESHCENTQGKV